MWKRVRPRRGYIALHNAREKVPVPIIADGAIAAKTVADGRLVPLLILNTSDRPELEELVRLHKDLPPGDVECQWGITGPKSRISLVLSFKRPVEAVAILDFDIADQGILVDQILEAKLLYIQTGREGDRLKTHLNAPKMIVEIPDTGVRELWEKTYHRHVAKRMRDKGLSRFQARRAAEEIIKMSREFSRQMRRTRQ
jgi:hypothetical protein